MKYNRRLLIISSEVVAANNWQIVGGNYNRTDRNNSFISNVKQVIAHPEFKAQAFWSYDIAILLVRTILFLPTAI